MIQQFLRECFPDYDPSFFASISEAEDPSEIIRSILFEEDNTITADDYSKSPRDDYKYAAILEVFPDLDPIFIDYFVEVFEEEETDEFIAKVAYYLNHENEIKKIKKKVKLSLSYFMEDERPIVKTFSSYAEAAKSIEPKVHPLYFKGGNFKKGSRIAIFTNY